MRDLLSTILRFAAVLLGCISVHGIHSADAQTVPTPSMADQLIKEKKTDKAIEVLDYGEKMIPAYNVPRTWDSGAFQVAECYYKAGANEKAEEIIGELANRAVEYMRWYLSLSDSKLALSSENFIYYAGQLDAEVKLMEQHKSDKLKEEYAPQLQQLYGRYLERMNLN